MISKIDLKMSSRKLIFNLFILLCSCQIISPKINKIARTNEIVYELDSLQYTKILNNSINLVKKNVNKTEFVFNDSSDHLVTQIRYGSFFEESRKHLIIAAKSQEYIYFTILTLIDTTFQKLLSEDIWLNNFIGFYITDINGDKENDFIKITMASSGCCPREQHSVYIYQKRSGDFYHPLPFMNPEFLPDKKLIVGYEYGQPIDIHLYKFGWNDYKLDTLEYIEHNIIDSTNRTFLRILNPISIKPDTTVIDFIPLEYKDISDWFLSIE